MIQTPGILRSARWSLKTKGMVTILPRARSKRRECTYVRRQDLVCKDCGRGFYPTAGEQELLASRGFENRPSAQALHETLARQQRHATTAVSARCWMLAACTTARFPSSPRDRRPLLSDCLAYEAN